MNLLVKKNNSWLSEHTRNNEIFNKSQKTEEKF